MKKYNLAFVLSTGGARGMAHIGIIDTLEKHNIIPDCIVGSSAGALIGGIYAAGNLKEFKKAIIKDTKKEIFKVISFWPNKDGLIKGDKFLKELAVFTKNKKIEDLDKKFIAVATDLVSGKKKLLQKGDLALAIRASTSVPILFAPVYYQDQVLVDGGVLDPLPIEEALKIAKKVIAVRVDGPFNHEVPKTYNIVNIIERIMVIYQSKLVNMLLKKHKKNIFLLEPNVGQLGTMDYLKVRGAIKAGQKEAIKHIDEIKKFVFKK